jgi:nicotinate-nucleotide adenylyltransferase
LIGGDNCGLFDKWRNYVKILNNFSVWAYPRNKSDMSLEFAKAMPIIDAPLLDYASTDIRVAIKTGGVPDGLSARVLAYVQENKLYRE